MNRGLSRQNTKPSAFAPASTAASASTSRVIPQILISTSLEPSVAPDAGRRQFAARREKFLQRRARVARGHEALANQERATPVLPELQDVVMRLQPAFAHRNHVGRNP